MHVSAVFTVLALRTFASARPNDPPGYPHGPGYPQPGKCIHDYKSQRHHQTMLDRYLHLWNTGDISQVNSTFTPAVVLQIDRFPTGTKGSQDLTPYAKTGSEFGAFVQKTRSSVQAYTVEPRIWAGEDANIFLRWTLKAVMSADFTKATGIPTDLKAGDPVEYNGTEFLKLDPCTGLIEEVDSAQDLITFMYNLGNDIALVPRGGA